MTDLSRRRVLRAVGCVAGVLVGGCLGHDTRSPEASETVTTDSAGRDPSVPRRLRDPGSASTWHQERGGPGNRSFAPDGRAGETAPSVDWSTAPAGSPDATECLGFEAPVVGAERIFATFRSRLAECPASTLDRLQSLDAATGEHSWSIRLGADSDGRWRPSHPVYRDGDVLVGFGSTLHAIDAEDGSERWSLDVADPIGHVLSTPEATYVGHAHSVRAVTGDGRIAWDSPSTFDSWTSCRPAVADGRIYVGTENGRLYALDASDGTEIWTEAIRREGDASAVDRVVVTDDEVVASADGGLTTLDRNGSVRWRASDPLGPPATDGETLYGGTRDGRVRALQASDGSVRWEREYGRDPSSLVDGVHGAPVVTDDAVYVATRDGRTLALDPERGSELWAANRDVANLVLADRTLYGTHGIEGHLVAMRWGADATDSSSTVAGDASAGGTLSLD